MKIFNKIIGSFGEEQATKYLKKNKYKILARNYTTHIGEVDIIAQDKKVVVFVEVKTRTTQQFGRPVDAVDHRKRHKIQLVAQEFLQKKNVENTEIRFDVIEILDGEINHIIAGF